MKTAKELIISEEEKSIELFVNFLTKVDVMGPDECWLWTGYRHKKGYGQYWYKERKVLANRFSYALFVGPIQDGLLALHKCDNPSCCNPKHLFIGTDSDNMVDKVNKGRHKSWTQKLTEENVVIIKKMLKRGFRQKDISSIFEISNQTTSAIKHNKTWSHITI